MEKEAAVQKVFNDIYKPVFLEKCARNGVSFKSEEDIEAALTTAVLLKQANVSKVAPKSQPSIVKQAALDLAELLQGPAKPEISADLVDALNTL